MVDLMAF